MTSQIIKTTSDDKIKLVSSENYNYIFNKQDGFFARWGKTKEEDPIMAPGPEIADIEISAGHCKGNCKICYKGNSQQSAVQYMTLDNFKILFDKIKEPCLNQIAFGITDVDSNPDLWSIMRHCRENGIIPNITVNGFGITDEDIHNLATICGAVAVSHYGDECFSVVRRLTEEMKKPGSTLKQVNIHQIVCVERLGQCHKLIEEVKTNQSLKDLNAVVFLLIKPKGPRNTFSPLENLEQFYDLFDHAVRNGVRIGHDSCSAPLVLKAAQKFNRPEIVESVEPCCATLFSSYFDVNSVYYPCSFAAGEGEWAEGLPVTKDTDFIKDIWHHEKTKAWRANSLGLTNKCNCSMKSSCRVCPIWKEITPCFK